MIFAKPGSVLDLIHIVAAYNGFLPGVSLVRGLVQGKITAGGLTTTVKLANISLGDISMIGI